MPRPIIVPAAATAIVARLGLVMLVARLWFVT
jgi:hypothetical protein